MSQKGGEKEKGKECGKSGKAGKENGKGGKTVAELACN